MSAIPQSHEWSTDDLPADRRSYLEDAWTFEEITDLIVSEAKPHVPAEVRPFESARVGTQEARSRQIVIRITVSPRACDLMFNARDGLRARYWQGGSIGDQASGYLIRLLIPLLSTSVAKYAPIVHGKKTEPMSLSEIERSFRGKSAKIWPYERDVRGQTKMPFQGLPQLHVQRWFENESSGPKGPMWRWTPADRDLEVKGALIDPEGVEYFPDGKKDRAEQIRLYGFT